MEHRFSCGRREYAVQVDPAGSGFRLRVDGREHQVRLLRRSAGILDLEVDGRRHRIPFAVDGKRCFVALSGTSYLVERQERVPRRRTWHHPDHTLEAQMPGLVRSVRVRQGQEVGRGQILVVLEAMKMEIRIAAPEPARIVRIGCREGDQVERGQVLVDLEPV